MFLAACADFDDCLVAPRFGIISPHPSCWHLCPSSFLFHIVVYVFHLLFCVSCNFVLVYFPHVGHSYIYFIASSYVSSVFFPCVSRNIPIISVRWQ